MNSFCFLFAFFLFSHPLKLYADVDLQARDQILKAYSSGNLEETRRQIDPYLTSHPEDVEMWGLAGDLYFYEGNFREAENRYRRSIELQPSSPWWQLALARLLAAEGNYQESEKHYRAILQNSPNHLTAAQELLNVLLFQGKWGEALEMTEALGLPLADSWFLQYVKSALLVNTGKLLKAQASLEKLIENQPAFLHPRVELCAIYLRHGEYEKCGPYLRDFEVDQVEDVEFCILAASYHMKKRDFEEASRWIGRALKLSPHQQEIVSLQYINEMHLGRIVLDEVRKMERGVKSSLMEHYRKAMILMEAGNMLQAQEKIRWLRRYYPEDLELKLMAAVIEGELGNLDESVREMEELTHAKTDKITILDMAQEMHQEFVRQREFEQQVKAGPWEGASESKTRYFQVHSNIKWIYGEEHLEEFDNYTDQIIEALKPLFGNPPKLDDRAILKIYADKKTFIREAYDYLFSDAIFFAGVYVHERNAIYYHYNKELKMGGVIHEIVHFILHHAMSNIPSWLDEGVADYFAIELSKSDLLERRLEGKRYMEQLSHFGNLPDLDVIIKMRDYSPRSYILWRNAVKFMFEFEKGKYLPLLKRYVDLVSNESFKTDPFREAFAGVWQAMQADWKTFGRSE